MIAAATVGGILLATVTLYGILGGADFGGGLWDLLAGGDRRGHAPRRLIDESITPVWEANHVWLVFALVIFWTAFPVAFASVMTAAALPLWLAVGGIVLRGAGFAFRKEVSGLGLQRVFGAVFAFSSLLTPFFMGTVIGAVAAGQIPADASHASLADEIDGPPRRPPSAGLLHPPRAGRRGGDRAPVAGHAARAARPGRGAAA